MVAAPPLAELVLNSLLLGGIYALTSLGFSIVFRVVGILNLAHGDLVMVSGLFAYLVFTSDLMPFTIRLLFVVLLIPLFAALGLAFERVLIRPLLRKPPNEALLSSVLVTLGFSLVLQDVWANSFGTLQKSITSESLGLPIITVAGLTIASSRLLALLFIVIASILLFVFVRKSYVGKAMRAISQDREAAIFLGVNLPNTSMITFGLGTSLAAVGGILLVIIQSVAPFSGLPLTVKALAVIVLGGTGSMIGPLIGGIALGSAETLSAFFIDPYWSPGIAVIILVAVLLLRPTGLVRR